MPPRGWRRRWIATPATADSAGTMGLFDWLFRSTPQLPIQVWVDEEDRRRGLARAVRQDLADGRHALVVAHFPDELVACGQALAAAGVAFATLPRWTDADAQALTGAPRAVAVLARSLPEAAATATSPPARGRALVHAAELHVLPAANARVAAFARNLPVAAESVGHASLTSPHVGAFAWPGLRSLLERLGLKPDDPIANPMVTSVLHKALRAYAAKSTGDRAANTLAEWMERNGPPRVR